MQKKSIGKTKEILQSFSDCKAGYIKRIAMEEQQYILQVH
jgi:hypothetical protein